VTLDVRLQRAGTSAAWLRGGVGTAAVCRCRTARSARRWMRSLGAYSRLAIDRLRIAVRGAVAAGSSLSYQAAYNQIL